MYYSYIETPLGQLLLAGDNAGLRRISFQQGGKQQHEAGWIEDRRRLCESMRQLDAYFAGTLREFSLDLAPLGTPFQRAVWDALLAIPYGQTISYSALARRLGKPQAARAVGAANGRNPLPIVIPCHRVVGNTGKLTGYGGGVEVKAALLAFERRNASPPGTQPTLPFPGFLSGQSVGCGRGD